MSVPLRLLYCHCAYAQVVPKATKDAVLEGLAASGVPFDAVPDLCQLSAQRDPSLAELVGGDGPARIAACYPRAVKWLFHSAGLALPESVEVLNMRTDTPEDVLSRLTTPSDASA